MEASGPTSSFISAALSYLRTSTEKAEPAYEGSWPGPQLPTAEGHELSESLEVFLEMTFLIGENGCIPQNV